MITKIVEFTNGFNWGKFLVAKFDETEWARQSGLAPVIPALRRSLLRHVGWAPEHVWILDLQTGEGACFRPGGLASADLEKHRVWVCPMYEVFLGWFYRHKEHWSDVRTLPDIIEATDPETMAASAVYGHRRNGPDVP